MWKKHALTTLYITFVTFWKSYHTEIQQLKHKSLKSLSQSFCIKLFYILYQQLKAEIAPKAGTPYLDGEQCLLCEKERYERNKKG